MKAQVKKEETFTAKEIATLKNPKTNNFENANDLMWNTVNGFAKRNKKDETCAKLCNEYQQMVGANIDMSEAEKASLLKAILGLMSKKGSAKDKQIIDIYNFWQKKEA